MAILARNRRVFDERLPDGRSVDDAVRDLSRRTAQDDDAGPVGIIMGTGANAGRGFEMIPRNPDNPYESPQQTKRGFELRDTLRHGGVPEDYRDPTAAQFPVNALGTPVNDGYGAGYNKSALDRGYAPPIRTVAPAVDEPMPAERDVYAGARNPAVPQLADLPAPPAMIQRNNKGRPVAVIGGDDPITANRALIREQEGYKAPRSTKDQILSFLTGGIGAGIDYATNQNTRNRWAVGEDIAREEGQNQRELADRQSSLREDVLRSQIGENEAQAQRALREPVSRDPGFTLGEGQARYDSQGNVVATRPGKPPAEKLPERNVVNGALVERQADGSWKPVYESPDKPDTTGFTNEQITRNISEAAAEQSKVERALKDTAPTISKPSQYAGEPPTVERNPIYADLENRRDKLIDFQRTERGKLKAPTRGERRGSATQFKPASDGKYHYTQAQIRANLNGKSYEETVAHLKSLPNVVIDQ